MRISDWSSDVCSSDLPRGAVRRRQTLGPRPRTGAVRAARIHEPEGRDGVARRWPLSFLPGEGRGPVTTGPMLDPGLRRGGLSGARGAVHPSALTSAIRSFRLNLPPMLLGSAVRIYP